MQTEQKTKHTPGPWAFTEGDKDRGMMSEIFRENDHEFRIGFVTCESHNAAQRAEDIANAKLMADAPDMLGTLMTLVESLDEGEDAATILNYINTQCRHFAEKHA